MWPFKRKPKVRYEIGGTYMSDGFKLKIIVDGEEMLNEYVSLLAIDAHNKKIDQLRTSYYMKLKGLDNVIKASNKASSQQSSIWHVLGCMPTTDRSVVEKAFRKMSMVYHPDCGGTSGAFQTLSKAKELALAKCK